MQVLNTILEANVADFCSFWLMLKVKCQIISTIQLDFELQALYLFVTPEKGVADAHVNGSQTHLAMPRQEHHLWQNFVL